MNLEEMLSIARLQNFTDVHVSPDFPLIGRKNGKLTVLEANPVSEDGVRRIADSLMSETEKLAFFAKDPVVFMYTTPDRQRYRVSAYYTGNKPALSFRIVNDKISSPIRLGLPKDVIDLASLKEGLIVIASPSSEGKTTVMASMTEWLNQNRNYHVLSAGYPCEHVFASRRCLVHTADLVREDAGKVLHNALFADIDAVFLDTLPDAEILEKVFRLCAAGKLCVISVYGENAADAVHNLTGLVTGRQKARFRELLCTYLKAVYVQRKITSSLTQGPVLAYELMRASAEACEAIAEEDGGMLEEIIRTDAGMRSLDESLAKLVRENNLSKEEAEPYIREEARFSKYLIEGR